MSEHVMLSGTVNTFKNCYLFIYLSIIKLKLDAQQHVTNCQEII